MRIRTSHELPAPASEASAPASLDSAGPRDGLSHSSRAHVDRALRIDQAVNRFTPKAGPSSELRQAIAAISRGLNSYRDNRALVILPAVTFTMLGIVAIMSPVFPGVDERNLLGILLISAGVCRLCLALHARTSGARLVGSGLSALNLVTGLVLLSIPFLQHGHLTLLLAGYLVVDGIFSTVLSLHHRSQSGWGWLLTSAFATVVLGTMILYKWPIVSGTSAAVAVGLFLVLTGAALANLGVSGEGIAVRLTQTFGDAVERRATR